MIYAYLTSTKDQTCKFKHKLIIIDSDIDPSPWPKFCLKSKIRENNLFLKFVSKLLRFGFLRTRTSHLKIHSQPDIFAEHMAGLESFLQKTENTHFCQRDITG